VAERGAPVRGPVYADRHKPRRAPVAQEPPPPPGLGIGPQAGRTSVLRHLGDHRPHCGLEGPIGFGLGRANTVRGKKLGWTHLRNAGDGYVGGRQYLAS
jgi:hypothetical protein